MNRTIGAVLALLALCVLRVAECQFSDSTDCICTLEFNPVCVKGKTYGNPCAARCDGFTEADWVMGECAPKPSPKPCVCTKIYRPVCYQGKTYSNKCTAKCAGVKVWVAGACGKGDKCNCPKIKAPVCAKGKTFSNGCLAKCRGYLKYKKGACRCKCPKIKAPVCAKGKTFSNGCLAKCHGYLKHQKGACPCLCPFIYVPVCVESIGRTFDSACAAKCKGYRKYTNGACEPPPIVCDANSSTAKCAGDICGTSDSPCAKNPLVTCLINPCSSATYLGTKLKNLQCKPIYVNKSVLKVEKNCNKPLPPLVCPAGTPQARCAGNPCELTTAPCKIDDRYVCLVNSCSELTYLGTSLKNATCTAIFVNPLTRKLVKECIAS